MKSNSLILYPFPSFLKTAVRISWRRIISFILRVLKKAVNLDSSLSNALFLDKWLSSAKELFKGAFMAQGMINKLHHGCRYRGDEQCHHVI